MSNKSVLVVEDSPYLAESLFDMLNMKGYEAIIAPSGREGVTIALERHPDLILLDIRLPDIDGYEVYRRIRSDEWGTKAKIMDLPPDCVLFKPEWSVKDLLEKIESKLID